MKKLVGFKTMIDSTKNHLLELALQIASDAHKGQTDKAGLPYILHPLRVMMKQTTLEEMIVALLHDVIEDSTYTVKDLSKKGFPEEIVSAVSALTKPEEISYKAYLEVVRQNPLALKVKLADLEDNLNPLRLKELTEQHIQRLKKYHRAYKYLTGEMGLTS
jgi:(p)ppGpp synthase/HD superfamily hydrolase